MNIFAKKSKLISLSESFEIQTIQKYDDNMVIIDLKKNNKNWVSVVECIILVTNDIQTIIMIIIQYLNIFLLIKNIRDLCSMVRIKKAPKKAKKTLELIGKLLSFTTYI